MLMHVGIYVIGGACERAWLCEISKYIYWLLINDFDKAYTATLIM